MTAFAFYRHKKNQGQRVLFLFDYDGTLCAEVKHLPASKVQPEEGAVRAMEDLQRKRDEPVMLSARPFHALREGFPVIGMAYISDEGKLVTQTDVNVAYNLREVVIGTMPDWTETAARLAVALPGLPEGDELSDEGAAYFCFIKPDNAYYSTVQAAFDAEIAYLNGLGDEQFERIDYGNGVQIAAVKRTRKLQGLKEYLRLQNIKYCSNDSDDFSSLFPDFIGAVMYFEDSPHEAVAECMRWVKDLTLDNGERVGYVVKVARPGDDVNEVPEYADEVVENPKAVVALLQQMAAYERWE